MTKAAEGHRWRLLTVVPWVVIGVVIGIVMVVLSSGASDSRDQSTYLSLGLVALSLVIAGAAVWLRYSFSRYLRYWRLRFIYEQRSGSSS